MTKAWLFTHQWCLKSLCKFEVSQQHDCYQCMLSWNISFSGILFEIRGMHKANSWDFAVQKIIYVLITTIVIPVMFYRIANRVEFTRFASIGDFQVSLITVRLGTQHIFCKGFSPVILTLQKVLKEIYNIVVHMQSLRFSVRFEQKLS